MDEHNTVRILVSGPEETGQRLDSFLSAQLDSFSRNAIQNLIADGYVTADNQPLKKNHRMSCHEIISVRIPEPHLVDLQPENLPLDIIYEDEDIIVINKTRGMVVHPATGNWSGTLVNALMYHCGNRLSGINGKIRPGIVHRIDKDTSGLLVIAKNDQAHQELAKQISLHNVRREYEMIICGSLKEDNGTICKPIGRHPINRKKMAVVPNGKRALTHYHVLARYSGYTYVRCVLETGRTHQIRVHMSSIGHPIIGDPVYGVKKDRFSYLNGQCLHAVSLTFLHPRTKASMYFHAPLPAYFSNLLQTLQGKKPNSNK